MSLSPYSPLLDNSSWREMVLARIGGTTNGMVEVQRQEDFSNREGSQGHVLGGDAGEGTEEGPKWVTHGKKMVQKDDQEVTEFHSGHCGWSLS